MHLTTFLDQVRRLGISGAIGLLLLHACALLTCTRKAEHHFYIINGDNVCFHSVLPSQMFLMEGQCPL